MERARAQKWMGGFLTKAHCLRSVCSDCLPGLIIGKSLHFCRRQRSREGDMKTSQEYTQEATPHYSASLTQGLPETGSSLVRDPPFPPPPKPATLVKMWLLHLLRPACTDQAGLYLVFMSEAIHSRRVWRGSDLCKKSTQLERGNLSPKLPTSLSSDSIQ